MNALLLPSGNTFIADTYVNDDPTPERAGGDHRDGGGNRASLWY
jgi:hypothetical protein